MALSLKPFARPLLKERLIELHGETHGYARRVNDLLPALGGKSIDHKTLLKVIGGSKPAPMWLAIALTRIAEDNLDLHRDEAISRLSTWFEHKEA